MKRKMKEDMAKAILSLAAALIFTLVACGLSYAQVDESTGTIRGTVYDVKNAVIPGATVTATNPLTGVNRTTTTGADGTYQIPQLNPATYQVQATAPGFERERANEVVVTVGQTVVLDGHLLVGSVSDVITVNGNVAPLIDVEQTQQASTLTEDSIQYLPNATRNLLNEVFTLPGVGSTAGAQAQNSGFYFGSTQVSVGASNGRGNLVTVNSGEDDYGTGAVRFYVPLDAIQEAQVNRNGYQAEFGFASGAAINYITKSGTNRFHGDAFGLFDDRYTNSQNFLTKLASSTNPYSQDFYGGGSVGGPILRDKLFFFGSYEFQKSDSAAIYSILSQPTLQPFNNSLNDTSCLTATPTNPNLTPSQGCFFRFLATDPRAKAADPTDAALAQEYLTNTQHSPVNPTGPNPFFPLSDPNLTSLATRDNGTFDTPLRNNKAIARFDLQLNNTNTITSTFSLAHGSNIIGGNAPDGAQNPTRDYEALVDWVHVFNPRLFNKVLFQFAYNSYNENTPNSNGPEIDIQGLNGPFGTLGHNFASTYDATEYRYEFSDALDFTKGNHEAKFGASYRPANYLINNPNYLQGEYDFYPGFAITGSPLEVGYPANGLASFPYMGLTLYNAGLAAAAGGFCPATSSTYCIPASTNFTAPETFALQVPYSFEGSAGSGLWSGTAHYAGVFAQDTWKAKPNLTLTFGGRVDFDAEPSPLKTYKFFSPRVGVAYAPFHDQRTLVRIGGGIFVAPTNFLEPLYTNLYGSVTGGSKYLTNTQANISEPNGSYGAYAPIIGLYQAAGPLKSPTAAQETSVGLAPGVFGRLAQQLDPNFTNQKVYQASASVAQQIARDYSLELSYIFYRGNHLPSPTLLGYTPSATVQDQVLGPVYTESPSYAAALPGGEAVDYASNGNSIYHGATVSVNKRLSQHIQGSANYTWSRSIDDTTDFNYAFASFRPNGTSLTQEKGVSDFNRTNVFVATAVYNTTGMKFRSSLLTETLGNITVGPVYSASTGSPFDILISLPFTNNTPNGNLQARPYHAQRNAGQGPGFDSFDLKFTKGFAIDRDNTKRLFVSMDSTNLFNAANFSSVYNFFPSTVDNSFTDSSGVFHQATATGPYGPNNQYINFATGPFNLHGGRPTSTTANLPLVYNGESAARQIQVGARFEF